MFVVHDCMCVRVCRGNDSMQARQGMHCSSLQPLWTATCRLSVVSLQSWKQSHRDIKLWLAVTALCYSFSSVPGLWANIHLRHHLHQQHKIGPRFEYLYPSVFCRQRCLGYAPWNYLFQLSGSLHWRKEICSNRFRVKLPLNAWLSLDECLPVGMIDLFSDHGTKQPTWFFQLSKQHPIFIARRININNEYK